MKLRLFVAFNIALSMAVPAYSDDAQRTQVSRPSEDDTAAAQTRGDEVMGFIVKGDKEATLDAIRKGSKLWQERSSELNLLVGQIDNASTVYGDIQKCVLSSYGSTSEFRVNLIYVCQYEEYLLEYKLAVDNLPSGWVVTNLKFSDTF